MKTQGYDVENVRIEDEAPLTTLATDIYIAAVIVQQLVHARAGKGPDQNGPDIGPESAREAPSTEPPPLRPLTDSFDEADQPLLEAFSARLEGATEK